MNCYSAFDGCSGGQQALERLGIVFDGVKNIYYSSEIDKYAQAVTAVQYPNTKLEKWLPEIKANDFKITDKLSQCNATIIHI